MAELGYKVQVSIPLDSGLAADTVVNTWYMRRIGGTEAAAVDEFCDDLGAFYSGLTTVLSAQLNTDLMRFKAYDLEDAEPRIPVLDEFRILGTPPAAGASLPHECCIVMSFNSTFVSGIGTGSRRGRIYLGPLQRSVIEDSGSRVQVTSAARIQVASVGDQLLADSSGSTQYRWSTFSQVLAGANNTNVDLGLSAVIGGYVDNEIDIQRRRGQLASARSTFS